MLMITKTECDRFWNTQTIAFITIYARLTVVISSHYNFQQKQQKAISLEYMACCKEVPEWPKFIVGQILILCNHLCN